jgi:glutamyl-tRNA reductase
MAILALGVSHRRAPVELLERLAIPEGSLPKAFRALMDQEAIGGAVILSTCNRVEVYAEVDSYHAGFGALKRFLADTGELDPDAFAEPLYAHYEGDAAEHLFAVAAGLDSMVVGEPQILSQVRTAIRAAQAEGAAGPGLAALFRAAIRTGRRVRAETSIGAAPEAIVQAGLDLADRHVGGIRGATATVVGAGQMAALAVKVLTERGAARVAIANRSPERARALAERHGAEAHELHALARAMAGADVIVACTGAAGIVIDAADVLGAHPTAERPPMFVLDLAVPRDVEPAVGELPGVLLVDVDDLAELARSAAPARQALAAGRAIVDEEVARYAARRQAARLAPLIQALRARGDRIREDELSKAMAKLESFSPAQREAVEAMAGAIVAKLLHEPIVRVKELSGPGAEHHARALAELFGLEFRPGP